MDPEYPEDWIRGICQVTWLWFPTTATWTYWADSTNIKQTLKSYLDVQPSCVVNHNS